MVIRSRRRTIHAVFAVAVLIVSFRAVSRGVSAPSITTLSPASGIAGTVVTITGANFGTDLLAGKIGWWGPFASGVAPNNLVPGRPNGRFVGSPTFTSDGGGAFKSTASSYLEIPDGGAGGTYDWTSGQWSAQVDFAFPATPVWGSFDHFLLVSRGSFNAGNGWEIQINKSLFQGKYQIMLESNHGVNSYHLVSSYLVVPGAFNRALFVCDAARIGTWYVNGVAGNPQPCAPTTSGPTNLLIGRYSDQPDHASNFPIARVQIWNRALAPADAALSTTTDPIPSTVSFNGIPATPTSWTPTSITVPVPAGVTTGPVVVTVGGLPSNGAIFTVPPIITGLSPSYGAPGSSLTISGMGFGATQGTGTVFLNGTPVTPTSWSATSIGVTVPAGATTGPVVVTAGAGGASNGLVFTVTLPPPPNVSNDLANGRIGWWGPFLSSAPPNNKVTGMPNGTVVGSPTFTSDGGGAFVSTAANYVRIPDGGAGGRYDWVSGAWSVQMDFAFPATPVFPSGPFLLVSKGSFSQGVGWELQINDGAFQGKYQVQSVSNHGVNSYHVVSAYLVSPGAFNRALFVCDTVGNGTWYVNGTAGNPQPCAPTAAAATDLLIGRYSDQPAYASSFPITRVQIWSRALSATEATLSTTTDPTSGGDVVGNTGPRSLFGVISPTAGGAGTIVALGGAATATTTANSAGQYSFSGLANGTYAVMPNKPGYGFTPASRTVTIDGADVSAVDFTAAVVPPTYTISGTVTPAGGGTSTVAVIGTDRTATADASGSFVLSGLASGTYTLSASKPGYVFVPPTQTVTIGGADITAAFTGVQGPTADRANSYDNAWEGAWIDHARALLTVTGKTSGLVLQIGDSLTHSGAYGQWPSQGQGQTAGDSQTLAWARATSWGTGNVDLTSKNGWYLAATDATALRGLTSSTGMSAVELVAGCCNGGPAMPANTDPATARQILGDASYSGNFQIDTLIAAFQDAQFAVVMLGSSEPDNPGNVAALTSIVDKLEAQHIVPILSTIPPRSDGFPNALNVQFNSAVRALAQARSLPLIDFYQEIVLRRPGDTWLGTLISADGLQPSASGAGFTAASSPYVPGGDPATLTTGDAALNVGYLLRSWLTVQKLREVKQSVIDGTNPQLQERDHRQ